jgi:hypothetical protein
MHPPIAGPMLRWVMRGQVAPAGFDLRGCGQLATGQIVATGHRLPCSVGSCPAWGRLLLLQLRATGAAQRVDDCGQALVVLRHVVQLRRQPHPQGTLPAAHWSLHDANKQYVRMMLIFVAGKTLDARLERMLTICDAGHTHRGSAGHTSQANLNGEELYAAVMLRYANNRSLTQ